MPIKSSCGLQTHGEIQRIFLRNFPVWHGFFARTGGLSNPPFDTLNTAYATTDSRAPENRDRLTKAIGASQCRYRVLNPCQGSKVAFIEDDDWKNNRSHVLIKTEAAFTRARHTFFMLSTADCLPVVFTDQSRGFYGVAHFGWRNLMEDFPENLMRVIGGQYGVLPKNIIVGIGPSIGPCCYRFENPVQCSESFWKPFLEKLSDGKVAIDLVGAFKSRIAACGVKTENFLDVQLCTGCNKTLFFSCYRNGYLSGRFPTVVGFL